MTPRAATARDQKEPNDALYVHLRLDAAGEEAALANEDVAQAAWTALGARMRMLRCEVLAVGGGPRHVEAVIRFPASLPLLHLAQCARDTSAEAAARAMTLETGRRVSPDAIWGRRCRLHTLSQADLPAVLCTFAAGITTEARNRIPEPHVV